MNKKYAVCVGVNEYPDPDNRLAGCVNDARDWSELLKAEGYAVITVTDSDATRHRIVDELGWMVANAGFGDRVVFTFSGHGTWVPDLDGDEADRRDEALCCYDFQSGGLLTDDIIQTIFGFARYGVGSLILSDSCHSGTVSRIASLTGTPSPAGTARFIPPHTFLPIDVDDAVRAEEKPANGSRATASLISGCGDLEYSYDAWFGSRPNGAFTRAAIDAFSPGASLSRWFGRIRDELPNGQYPQTPQLTTASAYRKYLRAL